MRAKGAAGIGELARLMHYWRLVEKNGENGEGLCGLGSVNHHLVSEVILKGRRNSYSLDVDASVIESEKEEAKVNYKGGKGYQSQMAFLFRVGAVLGDEHLSKVCVAQQLLAL